MRLRVAVADGATQSFRPASWAEGLVSGAMDGSLRPTRWSRSLSREVQLVAARWQAAGEPMHQLPWHQQARALRGGAAAFVELEIWRRARDWIWHALAVGDSNLFHFDHSGHLLRSFPLSPSSFTYRPVLLTTRGGTQDGEPRSWKRARGRFDGRDVFVLASDAVAWWLLRQSYDADCDLEELRQAIRSQTRFSSFVDDLRASESVPDDDMTIVLVERR